MGKVRMVFGWLVVGVVAVVGAIGCVGMAIHIALVWYVCMAFEGRPPTFGEYLPHRTEPAPWGYKTPVTPVLFSVTGLEGCTVEVTLGVKDGQTLHLEHQATPYTYSLNAKHGQRVFLTARNECVDRGYIGVEIIDRTQPIAGGSCFHPHCVANISGRVK